MKLNNCQLCGRIHKIHQKSAELCPECAIMHQAQYKVTLDRIIKLIGTANYRDIAQKVGYEPQRVQVYLANRFGNDDTFVHIDSIRKGYCYICNFKVYYALEHACLDCLQRVLAVLENRSMNQSSRMGTGRPVKVVLQSDASTSEDADVSADEEKAPDTVELFTVEPHHPPAFQKR